MVFQFMSDEDLIFEQYRMLRENLKRIINEEKEFDNIKFWGNDTIERIKFLCRLKKRVIQRNERSKKIERISSTST